MLSGQVHSGFDIVQRVLAPQAHTQIWRDKFVLNSAEPYSVFQTDNNPYDLRPLKYSSIPEKSTMIQGSSPTTSLL